MKIYCLKKEDAEYFKDYDPFDRLPILEVPAGFALIGMNEDKDKMERMAILIGTVSKERITVDWMAVDPKFQGQGVGEELLLKVFSIADKNDIEDICAVMSAEYLAESFTKSAKSFFEERLFEEEEDAFGDLVMSLSELKERDYFDQDLTKLPKTRPLSSFDSGELSALYNDLFSITEAECLFEKEFAKSMIDRDLSVVLMDGEEPCGALLVQEAGEFLLPVYYYAESEKESAALVLSSVMAASQKYKDRDVLLLQRGRKSYELLSGILSEHEKAKIITAKLSVYRNIVRG